MTDTDLLTLAAKAAGIAYRIDGDRLVEITADGHAEWNPLTDDGDALRLAVKLTDYEPYKSRGGFRILAGFDASEVRLSIVRAAAAIGEDLP